MLATRRSFRRRLAAGAPGRVEPAAARRAEAPVVVDDRAEAKRHDGAADELPSLAVVTEDGRVLWGAGPIRGLAEDDRVLAQA